MVLYLTIIAVCILAISAIVAPVFSVNFFIVLALVCAATVLVIIVDAFVATVCRLLPKKCANHESKAYVVSVKEKNFYEKLKIRKWKDKIPEIGHFTGFRKNKIAEPKSVEYLDRFLLEICYGELGHFFILFIGFAILLFFPLFDRPSLWFSISIPVSVINVLLNLPSIFILRYNSYKLKILRKSNLKKQQRETEKRTLEEVAAADGSQKEPLESVAIKTLRKSEEKFNKTDEKKNA